MKKLAPVLIMLAGVFWGTMGVFSSMMTDSGFTLLQTAAIRISVAAILLTLGIAVVKPSLLKFKLKDIWLFALIGIISISSMCLFYMYTIELSGLAVAAILLYMSPVVVTVFAALIFKEKITMFRAAALIFAVLGCVLVAGVGSASFSNPLALLTGLCSAITYGSYSIFGTMALKKYNPFTVTAISFVIGSVVLLSVCDLPGIVRIVTVSDTKALLITKMISIGIITAVAPFCLYTVGLKNTTASSAAIFACSEPVSATLFGLVVFHQLPSLLAFIGIALVMTAIVLLNVKTKGATK